MHVALLMCKINPQGSFKTVPSKIYRGKLKLFKFEHTQVNHNPKRPVFK
jgi:hypothetical protein